MGIRIAINGFGRIGRLILRAIHECERKDVEVIALNDLGSPEMNAHLLRRDTVHGRFPGNVEVDGQTLRAGSLAPLMLSEKDPAKLPWKELGIDIALECSGHFRKRDEAARHLAAGARRVLVSAPADGADLTVVYGVNHHDLTTEHQIVSNGSCTTNCVVPIASVLEETVGIESASLVTAHGYTGNQNLVDGLHHDFHRARAAAESMIPTTTGAAKAVALVLPALAGRLSGTALRVPIPNVSIAYLTFLAKRETSAEEIHSAMRAAASGRLNGVLDYSDEPLVSADYNHNSFSAVYDSGGTQVVQGRLCTVAAWYDNEWGFSMRMIDTAAAIGALLR